jgi:hypothetical protein
MPENDAKITCLSLSEKECLEIISKLTYRTVYVRLPVSDPKITITLQYFVKMPENNAKRTCLQLCKKECLEKISKLRNHIP